VKIGIVTTWFERGAAYVSRQYRAALEDRHELRIYARGGEKSGRGDPRWDDPAVTWGRSVPTHGNTAFHLGHFRSWLLREQPELVLFNEQHWWPPVLLCRDLGIRTAAYVDYYTEQTVPLFANYDLLLCHTRRHHSVFDWHPGAVYLPWGTEIELFVPSAETPVQPGVVTFFHSAGHNPHRKGTDFVLEAFGRMERKARLVIHAQRPLSEPLMRQVAEQSVELRTGDVAAPGLYHLGDVYVYPTRLEGLGLTVPEALACGLPAIVPDCPPMSEHVPDSAGCRVRIERYQPRGDGYYWPQCLVDVDALRAAMERYAERPAELEPLRRAARDHAERRLDWKLHARELPAILEAAAPPEEASRRAARAAALQFEKQRADLRLFYPWASRLLMRSADFLRPLASRYSGRGRTTNGS